MILNNLINEDFKDQEENKEHDLPNFQNLEINVD